MNPTNRLAARLSEWSYQLLLAAYPSHFRQEYGSEMRQVFLDCWRRAAGQGYGAQFKLWRGVALDLIISAPRECLAEWRGSLSAFNWRQAMNMPGASFLARQPGSWRETLWALLPYGLLILVVFLPVFLASIQVIPENWIGNGWTIVGGEVILIGASLGSIIIAWRKGWPRWSASWLLFWVIGGLGLLTIVFGKLGQGDGSSQALPIVVLPLLFAWLLYRMARRNPIAGLLGILPFATWPQVFLQEFIPAGTDALLNIAIFTMIGLVAMVLIRSGSWRLGFWLCAGLILAANALGLYAAQYLIALPPEYGQHYPIPSGQLALSVVTSTVGAFSILIGPFLARTVRELGMKCGFWGRIAYRLVLLGVLCVFTGTIIGPFAFSMGQQAMQFWTTYHLGQIFSGLGIILYILGIGMLFAAAASSRLRLRWIDSILITILPGLLPLFFWLFESISGDLRPNILLDRYHMVLVVCLGLVWWGLSYWLVIHFDLHHSAPPISKIV